MKAKANHIYTSDLHYRAAQPIKRGRIRITRGQALIFVAAFSFFFYLLSGFVFASEEKPALLLKEVTIQPGDSLWKLAVRHQEKAGMDVQELIDLLMEINHLDNAIIYPGQNIQIPVQS